MTQVKSDLRTAPPDYTETQSAVVPNYPLPAPGQILIGKGTGIAYAPQTISGDGTLSAAGALTITSIGGVVVGTMAFQNANSVTITGGTITGMPTPVAGTDVANKAYVDAATAGLSVHTSTRVATTAALTATYANGAAGVGATLTNSGALAALSIDGKALVVGDRVLVKNQGTTFQNGCYAVTNIGSGAVAWVLTRSTDFDQPAANEVIEGAAFIVEEGTVNAGTLWVETGPGPFTVGATAITFTELQAIPTGALLAANNLSDLANSTTARGNLGLGTAATQNTGTSGANLPFLNGTNAWSKTQTATPQALASGTSMDLSSCQNFTANVNGSTFTIANPSIAPGDGTYIAILVTFTTANTLAFGTNWKTTGYSPSTSGKDHLLFRYDSGANLQYLVGVRNAVNS